SSTRSKLSRDVSETWVATSGRQIGQKRKVVNVGRLEWLVIPGVGLPMFVGRLCRVAEPDSAAACIGYGETPRYRAANSGRYWPPKEQLTASCHHRESCTGYARAAPCRRRNRPIE